MKPRPNLASTYCNACTTAVLLFFLYTLPVGNCRFHSHAHPRHLLIEGAIGYHEDVTGVPYDDAWPFTVGLAVCQDGKPTSIVCGGSLIHPSVVLTAAHCLKPENGSPLPDTKYVCIIHGTTNMTQALKYPQNYTIVGAKELVINPNYTQLFDGGEFHITGDVAMIILNDTIPQPAHPSSWLYTHTSNPGFALLPNPYQLWDESDFTFFAMALGWGLDENFTAPIAPTPGAGGGDPEPQRLDNERVIYQMLSTNTGQCNNTDLFYGMTRQPNDTFCGAWTGGFQAMFTSSNVTVQSTTCKGDSGGPAIYPGSIVEPFNFQGDVLVGIVSSGPPCPYKATSGPIMPAEYTDVSKHVLWIHDEMKKRGMTPLKVATSPLRKAWADETCIPGNCYTENVMEGVLEGGNVDVNPIPTSPFASSGVGEGGRWRRGTVVGMMVLVVVSSVVLMP